MAATTAQAVAVDPAAGATTLATTPQSESTYQQHLARSFRTVVEMMQDRGVTETSLTNMTGDDVAAAAGGRLVFHLDDPPSGYRIIYELSPQGFKLARIRKLLDPVEGITNYLVIVNVLPASAAMKSIDELPIRPEIFEARRLLFNISRHALVPRHEPVRDEAEIQALLQKFMLKSRFHLPIIYAHDAMARYLALRHGQLVRVTRRSPTAGVHVVYRCCCTRAP